MQLTQDQQNAINVFMDFLLDDKAKYMVLEGPAGTGKTTLIAHLLKVMRTREKLYTVLLGNKSKENQWRVVVTATTNKAAGVLSEMDETVAPTIYSFLNLRAKEDYKTGELSFIPGRGYGEKSGYLLIVDESSMLNDSIFLHIDECLQNSKVLIVGDPYQLLQPTGPSAPKASIYPVMKSLICTRASLTQIVRHDSVIAQVGKQYRDAVETLQFPVVESNGVDIIEVNGSTFKDMVINTFVDTPYTANKARILCWTNPQVQAYNMYIRAARGLGALLEEGEVLVTNNTICSYGTKDFKGIATDTPVRITAIHNDLEQLGVCGRMVTVNHCYKKFLPNNPLEIPPLLRKMYQGKHFGHYFEIKNEWLDLRPIYTSTVHKAQGSTFDTVFVDQANIGRCTEPTDVARLMYVAITRAAKQVVLYGALPTRYQGVANELIATASTGTP